MHGGNGYSGAVCVNIHRFVNCNEKKVKENEQIRIEEKKEDNVQIEEEKRDEFYLNFYFSKWFLFIFSTWIKNYENPNPKWISSVFYARFVFNRFSMDVLFSAFNGFSFIQIEIIKSNNKNLGTNAFRLGCMCVCVEMQREENAQESITNERFLC